MPGATADAGFSPASALAVSGGVISAVGERAEAAALVGPGTRVVEPPGGTLLPGINDSHLHGCAFGGCRAGGGSPGTGRRVGRRGGPLTSPAPDRRDHFSTATRGEYPKVSKAIWNADYDTLSGLASAESALADLEGRLTRFKSREGK